MVSFLAATSVIASVRRLVYAQALAAWNQLIGGFVIHR